MTTHVSSGEAWGIVVLLASFVAFAVYMAVTVARDMARDHADDRARNAARVAAWRAYHAHRTAAASSVPPMG